MLGADGGFLSKLSAKLLSLNPTLLSDPPPIEEATNGNDICYQNPTIYCKDLYFGMRGVVGSWFLSPSRIISETVIVVLVATLIIFYFGRSTRTTSSGNGDGDGIVSATSSMSSLRPPKLMRIVTTIMFTLQVAYKVCGYPGKILVMVMPCNMLWILNMVLCNYNCYNLSHTILQLQCSYVGLVLVALANPDFSDTVLYGEVYFFYLHHFFLLYYILYYVFITRKVSTYIQTQNNDDEGDDVTTHNRKRRNGNRGVVLVFLDGMKLSLKWILLSCAYFALFYFGIVTPMSILSGLNLNYMLHPPPNQDDLVGQGYRIMSIVYCGVLFTVMRFVLVVAEFCWRKIHICVTRSSGGKTQVVTKKNA